MPGIYDQLNARLQDEGSGGLSPLDLGDLPVEQKQMMLALLRDPSSAFEGVTEQALREKLDGKVENFDETLEQLTQQHWLIRLGEAPRLRYRLNFRAKRGSTTSLNLWNLLSDRLPDDWKGTNAT
ncbi:MAG TPA: hypothetical protein VHD90_20740 [Phototrophicaceae bacterium]|nr:hypothetical protein [Phototrophicaceae bacterium]